MGNLQGHLNEYRQQLEKGEIQQAYRGLMEYMLSLRAYFQKQYPEFEVPGNLYFGYMDMTYFAIIPPELKQRKLKGGGRIPPRSIPVRGLAFGSKPTGPGGLFEPLRGKGWNKYKLTADPKASDSILEHVLVAEPDFGDLDALTKVIEIGTVKFIGDLEDLLSELGR